MSDNTRMDIVIDVDNFHDMAIIMEVALDDDTGPFDLRVDMTRFGDIELLGAWSTIKLALSEYGPRMKPGTHTLNLCDRQRSIYGYVWDSTTARNFVEQHVKCEVSCKVE